INWREIDLKIAVFGSGLMGSAVARDLVRSREVEQVVVYDIDVNRLRSLARVESSDKLQVKRHDVRKSSETFRLLRKFDVGVGALPHGLSEYAIESTLKAGVSFVDLIFGWLLDHSRTHSTAHNIASTSIPECRRGPGLTNILA